MQLTPQDIYINNGTIWLSQAAVISICDLEENHLCAARSKYKSTVRDSWCGRDTLPDTGKAWRWAKQGGTFFYALNNIPDRHPNNYRSLFPSAEELAAIAIATPADQDNFENHFKAAVKEGYKKYLHHYNNCTPAQQQNIAKYAALLLAAAEYIRLHQVNINKKPFFVRLARWASDNNVPYAPGNHRIIKAKVLAASATDDITTVAFIPRAGNVNAQKEFVEEEIRSWVLQMKSTGRNFSDAHISRKIRQMCLLTGKPVPSDRWIGMNMTEQHNVRYLTAKANFGSGSRFAKSYSGYQRFQNALYAGDCWQVDGTRINMVPHKTVTHDENGKKITAQQYLYIVAVRDVHSGDILGHTFTYNENRWEVLDALKKAVTTAGYLPYEIIFDKFPGHNTPEAKAYLQELEHMGVTITLSSSKTVKQNLERWFGTMQSVFLQESKYYYGEGVKSTRRSAHRSEDYLKTVARQANAEGFDWQAACNETDAIIEAYRNTPYKAWSDKHSHIEATPRELHDMSDKPDVRRLEEHEIYFLFGLKNKYKFRGQGLIEIVVRGITYCYRCTDYNVVSNYPEVLVSYSLDDLSHIHIYKPSDKIIKQYLGRVEIEKQAQRYGSKANWGTLSLNAAKISKLEHDQHEELQAKMAVGSDIMSLLSPMSMSKGDKEQAESEYLNRQFGIDSNIRPDTDDGAGLKIDVTSLY